MPTKDSRYYSREFKLSAVRRMVEGVNVSALSRELQVKRKRLYAWLACFRSGGPEALRPRGRPPKAVDPPGCPEPEAVGIERPEPASAVAPPKPAAPVDTVSAAEHAAARRRIADLERTVGRQQMEMDFFRRALRRVGDARQPTGGSGVTVSTRSSRK
jgi:transposase-like protein